MDLNWNKQFLTHGKKYFYTVNIFLLRYFKHFAVCVIIFKLFYTKTNMLWNETKQYPCILEKEIKGWRDYQVFPSSPAQPSQARRIWFPVTQPRFHDSTPWVCPSQSKPSNMLQSLLFFFLISFRCWISWICVCCWFVQVMFTGYWGEQGKIFFLRIEEEDFLQKR